MSPKEIEELCRTYSELSEPTEMVHDVISRSS